MQTVLITGATRGLGLEFARQYATAGWRVIAAGRSLSPELDQVARTPECRVEYHPLDVSDFDGIASLAARLADDAIDVLINNAGYFGQVPFSPEGIAHQQFGSVDYADWERTLRINVLAPVRMAECFIEQVARSPRGVIVNLTSILGSTGLNTLGGLYGYRVSKAALNAATRSLAIDLRKRGVMAIALHPGWVKTDMGGAGAELETPESVRGMRSLIAELRPEQIGPVYAWDGQTLPW